MIIQMRTVRIAIVGNSPCGSCVAACCKQNGHDYAVLLRGDEVRKFAAWSINAQLKQDDQLITERVLPYAEGRCQFLGTDDGCTIYEDRPQSCREFECVTAYNNDGVGRHGRFLQLNPHVLKLLDEM